MADSNNTNLLVTIGASNKAKAVLADAIKDFNSFWKSAGGKGAGMDKASSELDKYAQKMGLTGGKAQLVGGILAGTVAAGAVAVGVAAVKSAASFQTLTERLVTTAGESQKNLAMVQQGILNVSSATGVAANDAATGMYTVESAGFHGAAGIKVLTAAAQGAKMEGADVKTVADALTSAMRDYYLPASQAANVTSKMIEAVSMGKTNFQDFTGALHSVLPLASAAGIGFNDIAGSLASMTVHGMSADQAAQNMAEAIRTLQSPSAAMTQYLSQIGINSATLATKLGKEGLSGTLEEVSTAIMQHMGPSGKVLLNAFNQSKIAAQDAQTMFNAMPASLKNLAKAYSDGSMSYKDFIKSEKTLDPEQRNLINQYTSLMNNSKGFNNLLKSGSPAALSYSQALQKATGNATTMNVALMLTGKNAGYTAAAVKAVGNAHAEAGNKVKGWGDYQKTFNAQMDEAKASLHNVTVGIGLGLLPAVTMVMRTIAHILLPIADWITAHKKLAAGILVVIGVLATAIATILLVGSAIKKVQLAFGMMQGAIKAINMASMMNPWVLAIMAIVVIVVLIITHWNTVKKWFMDFVHFVSHIISDVVNFIKDHWWLLVGIFTGPIGIAIGLIIHFRTQIIDIFKDAGTWLLNAGRDIISGLEHGITGAAGKVFDTVKSIGSKAVTALKGVLKIFSPSRVFADIGTNIGLGLVQGIQGTQQHVTKATADLGNQAIMTGNAVVNGQASNITNNNSTTSNSQHHVNIQQVVLGSQGAVQQFFNSLNQDTINVGKGLTPVQGQY